MRIPLNPEYGPTLGQLLAPSWRRARPGVRLVAAIGGLAVAVLLVVLVASLLDRRFSHDGDIAFSFSYRGLHRTRADPGGYVKIARSSGGRLEDSYEVAPLRLAPYHGSSAGALPLAAAGYVDGLTRRFAGFRLEGEGKTRISASLTGYGVFYSALVDGRKLYGRDVMLLPGRPGARRGVVVQMLSGERATVAKPVASSGVLEKPLKSFSFG